MASLENVSPLDLVRYFQQTIETPFSFATVNFPLVPANGARVAIIFSIAPGETASVSTLSNGGATIGMQLNASFPVQTLLLSEVGPMIQQAWFGNAPGTAVTVTVWDVQLKSLPEATDHV